MISLEKICGEINHKNLFVNFSLTFLPGGVFQILGENASGKSSLLEIISSISRPTHGKILINEKDLYDHLDEYRENLIYLTHEHGLRLEASVFDNLAFYAAISGHELLLEASLKYFSLEDIAHKKCKYLSAGQKKLVQLARLLVKPSEIWLLDEPFVNLDQDNKIKLCNLISLRARDGGIIIFTAHEKIEVPNTNYIHLSDFKNG